MTDPNGPQSAAEQHRRRRMKRGGLDPDQSWAGTHRGGLPSEWKEWSDIPVGTPIEWVPDDFRIENERDYLRWAKRLLEERNRDVAYLTAALEEAEEWIENPHYRRLDLEGWLR